MGIETKFDKNHLVILGEHYKKQADLFLGFIKAIAPLQGSIPTMEPCWHHEGVWRFRFASVIHEVRRTFALAKIDGVDIWLSTIQFATLNFDSEPAKIRLTSGIISYDSDGNIYVQNKATGVKIQDNPDQTFLYLAMAQWGTSSAQSK